MIFGDGAAGALVGSGAPIATLRASRSVHADLVDHFRESGAGARLRLGRTLGA